MATKIKNIPILYGKEAENFLNNINKPKEKIDFSKQLQITKKILKKSKING
jgi:hypothetical protein